MRLTVFLILVMLCVGCEQAEVPEDAAAEAEGEARAGAVAEQLVGQPGPAMTLTTIDGAKIDLAEFYGKKPVYLKFWATWCVPCRKQMPEFERIYETLGDRLEVIAVNTGFADDEDAVRKYLSEVELKMPIAVDDGRLADLLDLQVTPQHVLIGLDGRIAYIGHLDGEPLDQALRAVLAGSVGTVATPTVPKAEKMLRLGDMVDEMPVATIDGETVEMGSANGEPLGVVFFSPWCESYLAESRPEVSVACRRAREAVEKEAAEGERKWIAVSDRLWATEGDLEQYRTDSGTLVRLALDATGEIFRRFGVRQIPTIALIDADGRIEKMIGPDNWDSAAGGLR